MSLSGSHTDRSDGLGENYFSIDDILATQERIPCKFEVPVYNLGYLDPGSDSEHISEGTKLELPFWLTQALCSRKKHTLSVEVPKQFREGYREILSADATVVDLHKLGPYYYSFGTKLLGFDFPEAPDIAKSLLQTFQNRFRSIMDSSQNSYNQDTTSLTQKLDETERAIFFSGQLGLNDFQRWETRQTEKLKISHMVDNHRKRKRAVMEMT